MDGAPSQEEGEMLALVQEAAEQARVPPPRWDGRLARVARDLARALSDDGPPPGAVVDFLGWYHGLTEPSPHLIAVEAGHPRPRESDRAAREQIRRVLSESQRSYARAGVGAQGRRFVIALGERHVEIEPLPRALPANGRVEFRARVVLAFSRPAGFLQAPDGVTRALAIEGGLLRASIDCAEAPGRYQIEVTGQDRFGAAVLANFPVWCGVDPPAAVSWQAAAPAPEDPEQAEAMILALVQRDRRRAGMSDLVLDGRLVALSRAHSEDMRGGGYVGHVSPTHRGPADRARRLGLNAALLLENVARAYSPEDVQAGLLDSPGHRQNILDPRVTHVGVGVALGESVGRRRELWVTQTFARFD